jgi:hypothetical protein
MKSMPSDFCRVMGGKTRDGLVARMERSGIRDGLIPDFAALHPGYGLVQAGRPQSQVSGLRYFVSSAR